MGHQGYRLHRVRTEDWPRYREIRLQMLQDTSRAYLETQREALASADEE